MPNPSEEFLRHLVAKALALPPAARSAFVANKCRNDAELERRLLEALAAAGDPSFGATSSRPAAEPGATPPPPPRAETRFVHVEDAGSTIGPYSLLQKLGEGGFGVVFLAQQSEPVRRRVALKIVKLGMDTAQVVARFEQERQALALMDHPHIAKVLDAGATSTGRPYFVMELCRGEPLTDYCDKNKLAIDERLALFEQVCHAVQHAHGKGIIHRDLKPSNVLVGMHDGVPHAKVIDFGIAKATQRLTDRTLFTEAQQVIGTLQYMSPEQAEGSLDIDTRTDVYALGVMLYELLTGSTPFDRETFATAALSEVHRLIRDVDPPKPSTRIGDSRESLATIAAQRRVEERRLPTIVRGELDWIAMKAIEKDRMRRYATANALADDVARFRRGEAVEAAPPSASYRLRKFLRRHRGPVAAAAVVFVALLLGIAGTLWGLFEAKAQGQLAERRAEAERQQRNRADGERDRAVRYRNQALDALRATTGEDVEKLIGSRTDLSVHERNYVETIAERWAAFAAQAGEDVEGRELRAEGLARVAELRSRFDHGEQVRTAVEQSLALWQRLHDQFPDSDHYRGELVRVRYRLAETLRTLGDVAGATAAFRTVIEGAEEFVKRHPDAAEFASYAASARKGLGNELRRAGQLRDARVELQRAIDAWQAMGADASPDAFRRFGLATTRGDLAALLKDLGEPQLALAEYEGATTVLRDMAARSPDDVALRTALANSLQNLGTVLDELGLNDRARTEYAASITELERLVADFPAVLTHQQMVARTQAKLGALLNRVGMQDAARQEFTAAHERQLHLATKYPTVPDYESDLARTEYGLAMLASRTGDAEDAASRLIAVRDRYQRLATSHPETPEYGMQLADAHNQLGIVRMGQQRRDEAEAAFLAGRDVATRLAAANPGNNEIDAGLANVRSSLGLLWKQLGRRDEARVELQAVLDVRLRIAARAPGMRRHQTMLGGGHCNLGNLLLADDPAAGLASFDAAVAVLQPLHERQPQDDLSRGFLRNAHLGRARALGALQRWADSATEWDRVVSLCEPKTRAYPSQQRALALAHGGAIDRAIADANTQADDAPGPAAKAFVARVLAIAAGAAGDRRTECGDRAIELLRAAVASGFDATKLGGDPDFATLHDRADFKALVGGS